MYRADGLNVPDVKRRYIMSRNALATQQKKFQVQPVTVLRTEHLAFIGARRSGTR